MVTHADEVARPLPVRPDRDRRRRRLPAARRPRPPARPAPRRRPARSSARRSARAPSSTTRSASAADLPAGWTRPSRRRAATACSRRGTDRQFDYAVGPTVLEALDVPAARPAHHGPPRGRPGRRSTPTTRSRPASRSSACAPARSRAPDPGPRPARRARSSTRDYAARRAAALVVAVECATPAEHLLLHLDGHRPEVTAGFDLALTELDDGFVVRGRVAGRRRARSSALALRAGRRERDGRPRPARPSPARERDGRPGRRPTACPSACMAAADSPRWAEIAERCLSCANCTLVCPTCFCTSVTQMSDLDGAEAVAERTLGQLLHARLRAASPAATSGRASRTATASG